MLREARNNNSPHAREISEFIDAGRLVTDSLIMQLLDDRLDKADCQRGCLLDGVPRTLVQVQMLEEIFRRRNWVLDHVVALHVPPEELAARLLARAKVEGREDDTPETMMRRMSIFEQETAPLLDYYRDQGTLRTISAVGTPEDVFRKILGALSGQMQAAGG
jgi:adenylate kinase